MTDLISREVAITTAVRAAIDWHRLANPQYSIAYCIGEAMRAIPAEETFEFGKWYDFQKGYVLEVNTEAFRISKEVTEWAIS